MYQKSTVRAAQNYAEALNRFNALAKGQSKAARGCVNQKRTCLKCAGSFSAFRSYGVSMPKPQGKFQSIRSAGGHSKISKHQNVMTQHGAFALFWGISPFLITASVSPETQILDFMADYALDRKQFPGNEALLGADSSPSFSATGESAQTITGMGIAKVKQRRCPDFVRIACLVGMHSPISPKKVEIAGHHRNLLQLKQPGPERVAKQKLSCRVIKNDFVEEIEKIRGSDRPPVRCHD
jgi:hypothetical protein